MRMYCLIVQVADLIGADPKEIIFTSGATESNNLAIKGVANFYREKKKHIITTQTDRESLTAMLLCLSRVSMRQCNAYADSHKMHYDVQLLSCWEVYSKAVPTTSRSYPASDCMLARSA